MLQNIRDNSQGWIAKTIVGVIVVLMALTGFDAIMKSTSHSMDAAQVNGENISNDELNRAVDMQRRQLIQQLGGRFDPSMLDDKRLREGALKALIDRKMLLHAATDAGFAFSQQAVDQLILLTPEFQQDGKFSPDRFDQVIRQMGYSRQQFRELLAQEMLIGQLRAGLAGSGFVTDQELRAFAALEQQTRDFATLAIKAHPEQVQVGEDQLKAYYDQHASEFMTPEQVVVEYVELKKAAFFDQVKVSDEDIKAQYEKEVANLGEQRKASHILLETGDKLNDEQAKAKLEELRKRIEQGEDFAKLAKEFSKDPGSAANGGDLGFAGKGVYDPAFESALFALKVGEVSAPVKSEFGWHLIRLDKIQAPKVPTLDSLKPQLEHDLKAQQVEQLFVEKTKELEDAAFEASDLAQPAQDLGLEVKQAPPFGREGGSGIAANRQVVQAAFSPEVLTEGGNSSALELDPDTVIVLRVKEHHKPEQQPLAALADSLRERIRKEQAGKLAKERGEALLADLRAGKTPVTQAQAGEAWKVVEAAKRNQDNVDPQVLQAVFRMPRPAAADKPGFSGLSQGNGDYLLLRLDGVSNAEAKLSDEELAMYRRFLASRSGQQDFQAFRRQLETEAKVKRF
ncbi:MAG TPA: SurA N-terminal domain-containing protein [Pseudomonas sp.]|nr:SurA N-terminal domain-containing protein [Pseudomonas sp.]